MKRVVYNSLAVLGVLSVGFVCANEKQEKIAGTENVTVDNVTSIDDISRIVVDKNEEIDVKAVISQISAMLESNADAKKINQDDLKRSMIYARVSEHLLSSAARKIGLHNDESVKEQIDTITRQVLVKAYISKIMRERVTQDAINKEYESYKEEFKTPKPGIEIGNILVKDEKTAKEMIAKLKAGEKFEDLAKKHSIAKSKDTGGHEDIVPVDALPPAMKMLANLKIGECSSEPFATQAGYHVIAVLSKKNVEALPLEKVQRNIEATIFRKELEKLIQTLMKTVNMKAYNDKGKEINIIPLLSEPLYKKDEQKAGNNQEGEKALTVEQSKEEKTEAAAPNANASQNTESAQQNDIKQPENQKGPGLLDKAKKFFGM